MINYLTFDFKKTKRKDNSPFTTAVPSDYDIMFGAFWLRRKNERLIYFLNA